METPFRKVRKFIEQHSMLADVSGILVAVSGGPDSVALLDMLLRLSAGINTQPPTPNFYLHVAHLDHKLRERESADDAEFVRALAHRRGIPFTGHSVDVRAAAEASARGIEETARDIRYDFLRRVACEQGFNRIAVGHTMTDQAETFLMRLIRGAGARGLAAMRPVRPFDVETPGGDAGTRGHGDTGTRGHGEAGTRGDGDAETPRDGEIAASARPGVSASPLLIRPLLCITREEVEDYCRKRKLEFRTDVTNRDPRYTRNRIRNEIIPKMAEINPGVIESIARAAENLGNDRDVLDSLSSTLLNEARIESAAQDDVSTSYSVRTLLNQSSGVRRTLIFEALRRARAGEGEISSVHVSDVEDLLQPDASGKRILLPGGLEIWREFDGLVIKRSVVGSNDYQFEISAGEPVCRAGNFAIAFQRGLSGAMRNTVVEATKRERERTGLNWMGVVLVDDALPKLLIIRPRRPGERAHVIGQQKTKKLKKLMIDHRIPSSRRANWPLVTTPDGRYVWSPGLPPAVEFTARDESQRVAVLQASGI